MKRSTAPVAGALAALALCAGAAAPALAGSAPAGPPTTVTVRVEGLRRTLLYATTVRTRRGWITRFGAPRGSCPASGAAGALDAATHHRWSGSYGTYGLSVISILGESHPFSSPYYWAIFVDGRYAQFGICDLRLRRGEQLLFAAVPDKGTEYPLMLSAPARARAGRPFAVRVETYGSGSAERPVAGALVDGVRTDARGYATVKVRRPGRARLTATLAGFIRDEATVAITR
ncbi:MAG TPA: hypothetical protein VKV27_13295 [Solirubrobacteraceae bacterium]|nr:hypothetical protein [Solirubrobacteraceae bacterium]